MSTPFLLQTGFTQTDIGAIQGGMGLLATIVGTLAGGAILSQIGINRSLWVFGGLQAISNLAYFVLAEVGQNYPLLVITINVENFCAGLGTAAFIAFLMSLCNQRFSATQYALLSSFMAFSRDILVAPAGTVAKSTGWPLFFWLSILVAIPGLMLLPIFAPWNSKPAPMPRPGLNDEEI
jgi:PAT family beta-lactamase induction signal transducer AmpG